MNRNFAKIVDGRVQFAPDELVDFPVEFPPEEDGGEPRIILCTVTNPSPDKLLAAGYVPVVTMPKPEDGEGYHYIDGYEIRHNDDTGTDEFVQVWERVDDPPPEPNPEISAERALNIILLGRDTE